MRLIYDRDTDSPYIDLVDRPSVESEEVVDGIVFDYDAQGRLVGIDIEHASQKVELERIGDVG
jgi:uncharacterized protein YuzE